MSYESPIKLITDLNYKITEDQERNVIKALCYYGIDIDKDELLKLLLNDRNQYDKGFSDGYAKANEDVRYGRWIETKNELPGEDHDWVIAVVREKDTGYTWVPRVMEYRKRLDDWLFQDEHGWLSDCSNKELEVVAWCPLPEPYIEKESDIYD